MCIRDLAPLRPSFRVCLFRSVLLGGIETKCRFPKLGLLALPTGCRALKPRAPTRSHRNRKLLGPAVCTPHPLTRPHLRPDLTKSLRPHVVSDDANDDDDDREIDDDGPAVEKALAALKLEAPIDSKVVGWRQGHEMLISRPAAGAPAFSATVKFFSMCKVSFRVRGTAATTDWEHEEVSSGVGEGAWVTYPAQCPVAIAFKVQPNAAAAAAAPPAEGDVGSSDAVVAASGVELKEAGAEGGVVLEWKGAGWFKGFVVYHRVEVA